jgi:hypothetical protein
MRVGNIQLTLQSQDTSQAQGAGRSSDVAKVLACTNSTSKFLGCATLDSEDTGGASLAVTESI